MRLKGLLSATLTVSLIVAPGLWWLTPNSLTQVPAMTLTTLQGKELSVPDTQGRPMLISFWATSCASCVEEIPQLIELYKELAPHGFEIVAIAMAYDPPNRVIALSHARQIPYPIALDIQGKAAQAFGGISLTPSSFLIAADGRVIEQQTGKLNIHRIRGLVLDTASRSQPLFPHQ
jgi:thiol-disulfide isomerase/thioredoxin